MANKNFYILVAATGLLLTGSLALAEPEAAAEAKAPTEVDISDLAEEYWRPRIDELEVIQNRRFEKSKKWEVALLYGLYQGSDYVNSKAFGGSLTYNWNNLFSSELSYLKISNTNSDFLQAVRTRYGFTPDYNEEKSQISLSSYWTPIYAKFSLLGKKISHFETYVGPGVGLTETNGSNFTLHAHLGEKFFINEHLILRIEWKISRYSERVNTTQGSTSVANGGPGFVETQTTRHNILFGLGWMF